MPGTALENTNVNKLVGFKSTDEWNFGRLKEIQQIIFLSI